jgi:hypothetical protein
VRAIRQTDTEIVSTLRALTVDWQDDTARAVTRRLRALPPKLFYAEDDVTALLDEGKFEESLLIVRLFLGLSKDQFNGVLASALGPGGSGIRRYQTDRARFLAALVDLGILDTMAAEVNRKAHWSDTLVERLRSGRGSAISGQRRGRGVEDFAETIVKRVFGNQYEARVAFMGARGQAAKCDLAIPNKREPRILIEAKGYGATGSKMTDVIGDIEKIIAAKRSDTTFLLFTDGLTWKQRRADLRKIVNYQNNGDIARIYTHAMADQFEADLLQLKQEHGL